MKIFSVCEKASICFFSILDMHTYYVFFGEYFKIKFPLKKLNQTDKLQRLIGMCYASRYLQNNTNVAFHVYED